MSYRSYLLQILSLFHFFSGFIATMVWLVGIALGALKLLTIYGIFDLKYNIVAYFVLIALSLLMICFLYLSIRKRSYNRNPALDTGNHQKSVEENTKLIKTLFIVIGPSVGSKHGIVQLVSVR